MQPSPQPQAVPSRWWYLGGLLVIMVGCLLFILLAFRGIFGLTDDFQRVVLPGRGEVRLASPGTYTVFYEHRSVVDGRVYATGERPPTFRCILRSKESGGHVPLRPTGGGTYSAGSRAGNALFEFKIPKAGVYEFLAAYPDGETSPRVVFAVGREFTKRLVTTVVGGFSLLFGSLIASILMVAVTAYRRYRATGAL